MVQRPAIGASTFITYITETVEAPNVLAAGIFH